MADESAASPLSGFVKLHETLVQLTREVSLMPLTAVEFAKVDQSPQAVRAVSLFTAVGERLGTLGVDLRTALAEFYSTVGPVLEAARFGEYVIKERAAVDGAQAIVREAESG